MILLEAQNIRKSFSSPKPFELLKGINLTIEANKRIAIVGKSGEGKTTLLHILATLDSKTSGSLLFQEAPITDTASFRLHNVGCIFQSFCLMLDQTVLANLLLVGQIARESIKKDSPQYTRALQLLEKVGLLDKAHLLARDLSGGQMQRVATARAFMQDPSIIFADEPTGNLDHDTALDVQNLLFDWVKQEKKSLILVTHDLDLAKKCDTVFLLEAGILTPFN